MDKLNRLKQRLDSAFDERNHYEAHQIARTIHARLLQSCLEAGGGDISHVLRFLLDTCVRLCDVNEVNSALDLGELFVNTLTTNAVDEKDGDTAHILDEFVTLFSPEQGSTSGQEKNPLAERRNRFLNKLLQWSSARASAAGATTAGGGIASSGGEAPPPQQTAAAAVPEEIDLD